MRLMQILIYLPFFLQGLSMAVDEFYFHRRRGLGAWERWGHPLDSLTVLIPFLYLLKTTPSTEALPVYIGLAAFSCVFVTKDEFVHREECDAKETWLHAVLFILHPLTFLSAAILWLQDDEGARDFFPVQTVVIFLFLIYQLVYWSRRSSRSLNEK
jgi:hypothetical protein